MIICDKCKKNRAEYFLSIGYRTDKNFQTFDLCQSDYDRFHEYFHADSIDSTDRSGAAVVKPKKISL